MTVGLFAALAVVFGPVVLPYLLIQAVIGFSLLEVVNYLEHYGLLRNKREDGRYERCLPEHSWNSNNVASNVLLYHLQRHSDHHANPTRRYQALRHVEEAPQLPTGYAGMIVLAWFPPLVAAGDGPAPARPLRRRRHPRQHPAAQARAGSSPATGRHREPLALPRLRLRLRRGGGASARGLPARARPGARSPTTGPAPIAASATRSTSSLTTRPRDRFRCDDGGDVASARTPYPEAARELLRQTLFGAARDQLEQRSWSEITMSDIAAAAGVSRQTLYKEFGNRNEFGLAFVIHEGERFLDDVEAAVKQHLDDPRAAVGAALELFLRTAGEDPLIRILLSDDGTGGMLPFVTTQGMPVVQWATARLGAGDRGGLAAGPQSRRPASSPRPWSGSRSATSPAPARRPRRPPPRSPTCSGPSSTGAGSLAAR